MAERRMFAKTIIDSDTFLDMPVTAQLLYFHLGMNADDDGFVNKPKSIMRMCSCKDDDIKLLIAKNFIIPFESGVVVIKHWRIHNYIRSDRYTETKFKAEKALLTAGSDNTYDFGIPSGRQVVYHPQTSGIPPTSETDTQVRIGKDSIGKDNIYYGGKNAQRFIPPTVEEVKKYCEERNNGIDANTFVDFYASKGWYVGKNKMKDWKAAVRTWEGTHRGSKKAVKEMTVEDWFRDEEADR